MWAIAGWSMVAIGLVLYVAFACLWVAVCAAKGVRYARARRRPGGE